MFSINNTGGDSITPLNSSNMMNVNLQGIVVILRKIQFYAGFSRLTRTTAPLNLYFIKHVPIDTHRYLIESISQCLHVKTMLASRFVSFYETIEAISKLCIRFLSNLCKNDLGRNLFSIANDCLVNLSDLSKMLVKKQMKYVAVPLDHAWKVPVLQELLNTRMNNLYVEGFDDYVTTEMINMLCNE